MCATHPVSRFRRRLRLLVLPLTPLMLAVLIYTVFIEPFTVEIIHRNITIDNLPREFEGFRIVQLSDIHLSRWMDHEDIGRYVDRSNALNADVLVLTGDFLTRQSDHIPRLGKVLRGLRAKHGVYAVLGNHDYWEDENAIAAALIDNGIDVLFDESSEISIGRAKLSIVGTDDLWEGDPDYGKAFRGISASDTCIALAHNPDAALLMNGRLADLVLSGHTHGGLINLPGFGAVLSSSGLGRKVVSGLHRIDGTQVYINRGLGRGTTLIPCRFRCKPEISVLTLHRAGDAL